MSRRSATAVVEFLKVWGGLTLLVVLGFWATYQYVGAPPPKAIRIATGSTDGAYYAFARRYERELAADGIALEVVPTAGSVENLAMLRKGEVTLALVQGGCATAEDRAQLQSLGSLFLEPIWVFTRAKRPFPRLAALKGRRVAIGAPGSGTHLLATQLLDLSGVTASNSVFIPAAVTEVGSLLSTGEADAAIVVASPEASYVHDILEQPSVELFNFERAVAHAREFRFLTPVVLYEGVMDLERNLPPHDTSLVAVAANLVARRDLHTSLIPAVLDAVTRVHGSGGVLEEPREFPSVDLVDLPLNDDAARYIRQGPSFFYRWLPYATAVQIDRLKLLVLPLIALLFPLFRVAPPLYQWRIRSKIYRWYREVREVDSLLQDEPIDGRVESIRDRLRELDREAASVSVPLAYTGELYHLRMHIRMLQEKLEKVAGRTRPAGPPVSPPAPSSSVPINRQ